MRFGETHASDPRQHERREGSGIDVSYRSLEAGARRLHLDTMTPRQRDRVELLHGSLTYRDRRLEGFDAAALVEVIEHLDPSRLESLSACL